MNKISHFKDKIQLRHVRLQLTSVLAIKLYRQQQKANLWALVCCFGLIFLRYHIYNMLQNIILTAEIFFLGGYTLNCTAKPIISPVLP